MLTSISPDHEVAKKVTPEHIGKMIDANAREMENSYKDKGQRRVFSLLYYVGAIATLLVVIILLKEEPDVMTEVLKIGLPAIATGLGGYGFGRSKRDDKE